MDWNSSSFRLQKSAKDMQSEAAEYLRRRRNMVPPKIDFDNLQLAPAPVEMPEFQKDQPSHAPILPESKECPSQKK